MGFAFKLGQDVAVLGAKGAGKTVFLHHIYHEAPRAVAFNVLAQKGFHVLSDAFVVDDTEALKRALEAGHKKVEFLVTRETAMNVAKLRVVYDRVIEICFEAQNIALINDELAAVTQGEYISPGMRLQTLWGRHPHVSHVFAGQRNQLLPKTLIAQAAHLIVFPISMYDASAYSRWLGFNLQEALQKAPYGSRKYLWLREMNWNVEEPAPLLVNEETGEMYVEPKNPVRVV